MCLRWIVCWGVSDVAFSTDGFSLASAVILFPDVRGRLRDSLDGCCWGIVLLKRSLLEAGLSVLEEEEEPNIDSVSDGAVLLPKRFMVVRLRQKTKLKGGRYVQKKWRQRYHSSCNDDGLPVIAFPLCLGPLASVYIA